MSYTRYTTHDCSLYYLVLEGKSYPDTMCI